MARRLLARIVAGGAAVLVVAVGLVALADATKSRHTTQDPDSRLRVELEASHRPGSGKALPALVRPLVGYCEAEIAATVTSAGVEELGAGRFRFTLRPALDRSDRRQLEGCLEDATVDHLSAEVTLMEDRASEAPATGTPPDR
ncbi:hypothetical protein HC251_12615 [Iamia sp. SCSIO 61187]|uniref:hypothetical protein n=1 Tax=Iamia sp. SCSIO 61187 TaxID=2722752 RepID=UPI001C627D67|nr:hypothetical protein [Iamia sp. SCSIO 61187]QYG93188.1 hypothetical protein HC251_12615 [Iamia sp. SCSIO 61187]